MSRCPKNCGCVGVCRVNLPHLAGAGKGGFKIAPGLSPYQAAHMDTPEVQAKLRSGEYEIASKGSDAANHR